MSDRYILTQRDLARPYAVAAVLDLAGAVLLVMGMSRGNTALIVIGFVALLLGGAVLVAAIMARYKVRTVVDLSDRGVTITSGGQQADAQWQAISGLTTDRRAIYLERDNDEPALKISSPRGADDPQLDELSDELTRRLDDSRGYRPLN